MKLDISKLKGFISKLSFIRMYSVFILPSVLIVVALFLLLVLSPLMGRSLQNQITRMSINSGRQLKSFGGARISQAQITVEREFQNMLAQDANDILSCLRQTTMRDPLVYNIFPSPEDTSILIFHNFGHRYRSTLEKLVDELGGHEAPTVVEITRSLSQSGSGSTSIDLTSNLFSDQMSSLPLDRMNEIERTIVEEMCRSVAESGLLYVNILEIPGYDYWKITSGVDSKTIRYRYEDTSQSVSACWYWQLGYWIIEDVFQTISKTNSNCRNIPKCPVKRLLSIDFDTSVAGASGAADKAHLPPSYIKTAIEGMTDSLTKRVSDEDMDVVHFRISVLLSADSISSFMEALCSEKEHVFTGWNGEETARTFKRNQITILESQIVPIDPRDAEHQLYYYGDEIVMRLDLVCEYLFDTKAYSAVKPPVVSQPADTGGWPSY